MYKLWPSYLLIDKLIYSRDRTDRGHQHAVNTRMITSSILMICFLLLLILFVLFTVLELCCTMKILWLVVLLLLS